MLNEYSVSVSPLTLPLPIKRGEELLCATDFGLSGNLKIPLGIVLTQSIALRCAKSFFAVSTATAASRQ